MEQQNKGKDNDLHYRSDRTCEHGHDGLRYHSDGSCVHCRKLTPELMSYRSMKDRVFNTNSANYAYYGGAGVGICEGWLGPDGFKNFLSDLGRRPPGTSLERLDTTLTGPLAYSPSNCCWANINRQNSNRRNVRLVELDGRRIPASRAARAVGLHQQSLYRQTYRIMKITNLTMTEAMQQVILDHRNRKRINKA